MVVLIHWYGHRITSRVFFPMVLTKLILGVDALGINDDGLLL
jgi:hypothetical protein